MQLREDQISALLRSVLATRDHEISCEELLSVMAVYVDQGEGEGATHLALARAHLRLCANCREESEALASIVRSSR